MPAARDESFEKGSLCGLRIEMKHLRIEFVRELDDLLFGDAQRFGFKALADFEIVVIMLGHSAFLFCSANRQRNCCVIPPDWAMPNVAACSPAPVPAWPGQLRTSLLSLGWKTMARSRTATQPRIWPDHFRRHSGPVKVVCGKATNWLLLGAPSVGKLRSVRHVLTINIKEEAS